MKKVITFLFFLFLAFITFCQNQGGNDEIKSSLLKDLITCQYFSYNLYGINKSAKTMILFNTFKKYIHDTILNNDPQGKKLISLVQSYLTSANAKYQEYNKSLLDAEDSSLSKGINSSLEIFKSILSDELLHRIDSTGKTKATVMVILALNEKELKYTVIPKLLYKSKTIKDIDGNIYNTIAIGTQIWMVENLKVTHYRNGDEIPNVQDNITWGNLKIGAYSNYDNDTNNAAIYGRLYNWYAATDNRNIAPTGWHVPTKAEWSTLINFLDGEKLAAGKMKESGILHWKSPNSDVTNESRFNALPGGERFAYYGTFHYITQHGRWWSSSIFNTGNAWDLTMNSTYNSVDIFCSKYSAGAYIRCIKD